MQFTHRYVVRSHLFLYDASMYGTPFVAAEEEDENDELETIAEIGKADTG